MVSDEAKEVVYIAITCFLIASVLTLVSLGVTLKGDMAAVRNEEIAKTKNMEQYREFNKYNNAEVYGEDIVALIRTYKGTDIEVYVDKVGGAMPYHLTLEAYKTEPDMAKLENLQVLFSPKYKYQAYLAYNSGDVTEVTGVAESTDGYSDVTGVVLIYKGLR